MALMLRFQMPVGYLPRRFGIVDACITNVPGVLTISHD